jgi:hypothetical protein
MKITLHYIPKNFYIYHNLNVIAFNHIAAVGKFMVIYFTVRNVDDLKTF